MVLRYIRNDTYHLARKDVPSGPHTVKRILDTLDMFTEREERLLCRPSRSRTDEPDRRKFHASQSPLLPHVCRLFNEEHIPKVDMNDDLFQPGTQYDFFGVLIGIQGVNERKVSALNKHEGAKVLHGVEGSVKGRPRDPSRNG